jgi:hypothetical protein
VCTFAVSWIWCTGQMTYATYCEVASSFLSLKRTTSATSQLTTSQCKYGRRFKKETDICTRVFVVSEGVKAAHVVGGVPGAVSKTTGGLIPPPDRFLHREHVHSFRPHSLSPRAVAVACTASARRRASPAPGFPSPGNTVSRATTRVCHAAVRRGDTRLSAHPSCRAST